MPTNDTAEAKARSKQFKDERGCNGKAYPVFRDDETFEQYYKCPVKLVKSYSWFALSLYQNYKDGYLPLSGGILDQPECIMKRVQFIGAVESRQLERKRKKEK